MCRQAKISPPPSDQNIELGIQGGGFVLAQDFPEGPTTYLFGTSILRESVDQIIELSNEIGTNVVDMCMGGGIDAMTHLSNLPTKAHPQDRIILLFMGNEMFVKSGQPKFSDGKYHMEHPKYLDDNGINRLINHLQTIVTRIRKCFDGDLFVIGPIPRALGSCCSKPAHRLPESPIFSTPLQYATLLNRFIAAHPQVQESVFFVPADKIFETGFNKNSLRDMTHLKESKMIELAHFIVNLTSTTITRPAPLLGDKPSFTTWAATLKQSLDEQLRKASLRQALLRQQQAATPPQPPQQILPPQQQAPPPQAPPPQAPPPQAPLPQQQVLHQEPQPLDQHQEVAMDEPPQLQQQQPPHEPPPQGLPLQNEQPVPPQNLVVQHVVLQDVVPQLVPPPMEQDLPPMPPLAEEGEIDQNDDDDIDDTSSEGSAMVVVEVPEDGANEYADDIQVVGHAGPNEQLLEGSEAEDDQDEMEETEDDRMEALMRLLDRNEDEPGDNGDGGQQPPPPPPPPPAIHA